MKGRFAARRVGLLALAALLGLTVIVGTGSAVADQGSVAVAAKKKCKKGKKSASAAKKKKKCKKKKKPAVTPPAPPAPPAPTLRATATWNDESDLDLVAWAPDGQFGIVFSNPIPSTQFSADDTNGFGPETFSDLLSPSSRQFSYGVCAASGTDGSTVVTINYVRANGTTNSFTSAPGDLDDSGDLYYIHVAGGFDPGTLPENPC